MKISFNDVLLFINVKNCIWLYHIIIGVGSITQRHTPVSYLNPQSDP